MQVQACSLHVGQESLVGLILIIPLSLAWSESTKATMKINSNDNPLILIQDITIFRIYNIPNPSCCGNPMVNLRPSQSLLSMIMLSSLPESSRSPSVLSTCFSMPGESGIGTSNTDNSNTKQSVRPRQTKEN